MEAAVARNNFGLILELKGIRAHQHTTSGNILGTLTQHCVVETGTGDVYGVGGVLNFMLVEGSSRGCAAGGRIDTAVAAQGTFGPVLQKTPGGSSNIPAIVVNVLLVLLHLSGVRSKLPWGSSAT